MAPFVRLLLRFKRPRTLIVSALLTVLLAAPTLALDPSLKITQYAHTAWTIRDGFSLGASFAMAQTPDGYIWLGSEFGLFRFDGVRAVHWQPPDGQQFAGRPYSLLVTRDGTLWIGTFEGLFSWDGSKLTGYSGIGKSFVTSLLEDHEGTVWAGMLFDSPGTPRGRLCAIRSGQTQCYGSDGVFGSFVWSLCEDSLGNLWAGAETGLWRWKPGPPKRYATPAGIRVADMTISSDGQLLIGMSTAGLKRMVAHKLEPYPIHSPINRNALLSDENVDSNKLLRDRDGGLWIGTHTRGLIHIHNGKTDVFTTSDGLSGDIACSLFEDREGNIWYASSRGLDRFRELPITAISPKEGLTSDLTSVTSATDGSVWLATRHGLKHWKSGRLEVFHLGNGMHGDSMQSLFEDYRGRIWVTVQGHGLAYFNDGRFVSVNAKVPSEEVYSITGDKAGNLWLSGNKGLSHVRDGRLVEHFPWSALGRDQQAKVLLFDPDRGGLWLAFWKDGGVLYFKDGQVRASYTEAEGLAKGKVAAIQLDHEGAVWASTQEGGVSRIKDGRIATLATKNGLPCDTIHWSIEDDDRSLWLYTACGLVRITRTELDAWIADPKHSVRTTLWDAMDGLRIPAMAPMTFSPAAAKATDGRLWFLSGDNVQIVDPHHLAFNRVPPPVHVEQIFANHKSYWRNLPRTTASQLRLPPLTRDLQIDYTALSLVAPEKVRFKYKLEGQDRDWREVVGEHRVQYSNLRPGNYRFRVIASNNSGVWNEQGDTLEFYVAPAYFQTNWFRALCAIFALGIVLLILQLRVRDLQHHFEMTLEARVSERTRIARELHDTLLQSFHGLLLRFQTVSMLLPERPIEAKEKLDSAIEHAADAITQGRDAVQGLRDSTLQANDLAEAISTLGEELANDGSNPGPADLRVAVQGESRNLHPILRDEIYKIAAEAMRNAFRHAQAQRIEVELHYDNEQFRLRVRDDGKGIDPAILSRHGREGHYGLPGMRERATGMSGKLDVWSKVGGGTEIELCIPGSKAYATGRRGFWSARNPATKV